jgi:hypothetical protein
MTASEEFEVDYSTPSSLGAEKEDAKTSHSFVGKTPDLFHRAISHSPVPTLCAFQPREFPFKEAGFLFFFVHFRKLVRVLLI